MTFHGWMMLVGLVFGLINVVLSVAFKHGWFAAWGWSVASIMFLGALLGELGL